VPGAGFALQAGIGLADSQLNGKPDAANGNGSFGSGSQGRTLSFRQAIEHRRFLYGSQRVGGPFSFIHQTNSNREQHYVFTLSGHPVDAITDVFANGEHIPLDGTGEPVSGNKFRGHLKFYFGTGTVAGDAALQAALVANTDGGWTATDQQRHCAKAYVHVTSWSNSVFPNGLPSFSFRVQGKQLFDPRAASVNISTSGTGAEPVITTSAAHGVVAGDMVFIQGHSGSTPDISGFYEVLSAPTTTTCTLQLYGGDTVSVTGTGGTLHKCTWSDNAALAITDYLLTASHRGGFGADYATEVAPAETELIAAANACDNRVAVPGEKIDIASVDTGADTVDLAAPKPNWSAGEGVLLQTTGTLPSPLAVDTTYYLIRTDDDTWQLATTETNALAGTEIVLTDTGTGTHTVERIWQEFTHDTATDEITLSQDERGWLLGDTAEIATAGTAPAPLATATDYFIVPVAGSPNKIKLATSRANAFNGTTIDITGTGSGTFHIRRTEETRYTANGVISTQPTIKSNFIDMVAAMVGDLVYTGGVYKIYAGVWRAPTLGITEADFRGPIKLETGLSREKHFNTIKGLYLGPASVDQLDDYPPVIDETALAEDDGETFAGEQNFALTNSPTMASRCARILLRRVNSPKTLTVPGMLKLWRHEPADVINVTYDRFGLSSAPYRVTDATLSIREEQGVPILGYDMVLRETASTVYDHDTDDDPVPPAAPALTPPNYTPPAPTALGFVEGAFGQTTGGGTLSWTASDDGFVVAGGEYIVEISSDGGSTWSEHGITTDVAFTLSGLAPGAYTAGVTAVSAFDVPSTRATAAVTVSTPAVLPTVSGLELRGDGGNTTVFTGRDAKFVWRDASVQGSFDLDAEPAGGDDGYIDPYFKDYEVRIKKTDGTLLRTEHTIDAVWDYTFEKNAEDYAAQESAAGAYRSFTIEIYQRGNQNQISALLAKITVSNPAFVALDGVSLSVKFNELQFGFTAPTDLDWEGVILWMSETASFTPSDANKIGEFAKTQNPIFFEADPDTTYYLRAAAFDAFGKTGLNQTSELTATTGTAGTEYFSNISADSISAGAITTPLITLGSNANVELDGPNQRIRILDDADTVRMVLGKTGAGATDWGLEVFNSAGTKKFDLQDGAIDVDGAEIQDATITGAKIGSAEITDAKIASATITGAKIGNATIDTINMVDGSINNVASNSSTTNSNVSTTEQTKLSQAITSDGGEVVIVARVKIVQTTTGNNQVRVRLKRGSTILFEETVNPISPDSDTDTKFVNISTVETPGSGSKTYSITTEGAPFGGSMSGTAQAQDRALFLLETLK